MLVFIKSQNEIEGFKEAGKIAGIILSKLLSNVDVGITTKELDSIAREECKKHNVTPTFLNYHGFPAAICASVNKTLVHGVPTDTPLKKHDIISIDVGATLDGFIGDTAETIEVGGTSPKNEVLITSCRNSLYMAIKKARAGNRLSEVSEIIQKIAKRNKYSVPTEYGGHGIDRHILHSDPFVANIPDYGEDLRLRPGMVFAIEPMFISGKNKLEIASNEWDIVANSNTAHCEHTVLVTDGDPLILTNRSKNG